MHSCIHHSKERVGREEGVCTYHPAVLCVSSFWEAVRSPSRKPGPPAENWDGLERIFPKLMGMTLGVLRPGERWELLFTGASDVPSNPPCLLERHKYCLINTSGDGGDDHGDISG